MSKNLKWKDSDIERRTERLREALRKSEALYGRITAKTVFDMGDVGGIAKPSKACDKDAATTGESYERRAEV